MKADNAYEQGNLSARILEKQNRLRLSQVFYSVVLLFKDSRSEAASPTRRHCQRDFDTPTSRLPEARPRWREYYGALRSTLSSVSPFTPTSSSFSRVALLSARAH